MNNICDKIIFHGLNSWFKNIIEKFGWITLQLSIIDNCYNKDSKHLKYKIKSYLYEIDSFTNKCKYKISVTNDEDRINDITILHDKVVCFKNIILEILTKYSYKYIIELYN
jgi:ribonuclease HII